VTKAQRDAAKTINYGVVYRLSAYGLAWRLGITKDEAQELLTRWNEEHPNMARMLRDLGQRAMTPELGNRGAVRTLNGRWRLFQLPRRGEEEYYKKKARIERAGANAPIQGTSADITKLALIYLDQAQSSHPVVFKILLAVHDEIVTECDQGDAEAVEQLLRSCMERAAQRWLKEVPIVVDTKITQTWQH
jgi:DNA polymerase-1